MPEQARILQFPGPASKRRSPGDALCVAKDYLSLAVDERQKRGVENTYRDLDVLLAVCGVLRERGNTSPAEVFEEATRIYSWVQSQGSSLGYFDERDFFLGESALLAGSACRFLGERADTDLWLDRAEASYRHTINPAASLARVAYVRLSLRYDAGRYADVLELLPSVALTFGKLGMNAELGKCRFLEAMSLKELGRFEESISCFQRLLSQHEFQADSGLRGMAMLNMGNIRSAEGDQREALASYRAAQPLLETAQRFVVLADLKGMVAETLTRMGQIGTAVDAFREAVADFVRLGVHTQAAYYRVMLAEVLLHAARPREAEWELLAALPTINEQKMVPEGFAAVALLQESVRQRKTDPRALAELRQHLQTAN
jgi:tetratricopeptide (TPR) repeat protein